MLPQKRARKRSGIVNICLVAFIGSLVWRLHHRSQLPKLLMQSVEAQNVSAVRQLLAEGADPSTHDSYHYSALYRAMYPFSGTNSPRNVKRTEQIMCLLLDAGAKPDCLTSALGFETDGPALKMIEKGAIVSPDMLGRAAQRNNARLMQRI